MLGLINADMLNSDDCLYYVETLEFPTGTLQKRALNNKSIFRTSINSKFLRALVEKSTIRISNNSIYNFCIVRLMRSQIPIVLNIASGATIELNIVASCNVSVFQVLNEGGYICIYHNVEMNSGTHCIIENEMV